MKYKKKIIIIAIVILSTILIKFSFWSLLGLIGTIFILLNEYIKYIAKESDYDLFESKKRNFQVIIFGSTNIWKDLNRRDFDRTKILSFAFYKRNLYADFLILKHRFSYLRDGGKVIFTIDCKNLRTCIDNKLYFPELIKFHRITLRALGKDCYMLYKNNYPILFQPIYSIFLVLNKFRNTDNSKTEKISKDQQQEILRKLLEIQDFCNERNLHMDIVFLNIGCNSVFIEYVKNTLTNEKQKASYSFLERTEIKL